jgi:photosystem II stability/assembly factor-like uncharacterized protein
VAGWLSGLSPRARRAIGLMAIASVIAAITSAHYLWPKSTVQSTRAVATTHSFPVERNGDFIRYQFLNLKVGWAVEIPQLPPRDPGWFWIFNTIDAAHHWHVQLFGQTANLTDTSASLQFTDRLHGFVLAGNPLFLFRTDDGGAHWSQSKLPSPDVELVQFIDPNNGWAVGAARNVQNPQVHLFQTRDAGVTWTLLPDPPPSANPFPIFLTQNEAWIGSHDRDTAYVYATIDGGLTWSRRYLPLSPGASDVFTDVRSLPDRGVEATEFSSQPAAGPPDMWTTFDQGATWTPVFVPPDTEAVATIACQDASHCWVATGFTLYKSIDGGRSWNASGQVPVGLQIFSVSDSRHAWAVIELGYGTGLASTSDGGSTWKPANVPIPEQTQ